MKDTELSKSTSRRDLLIGGGVAAATAAVASGLGISKAAADIKLPKVGSDNKYRYCLNMSTIRGQDLTIEEEVDVAGKAGYDAIEPWMRKIHAFVEKGGELKDLRKRIEDHGMTVESAIGFAKWIVDDDGERAKGMEDAKKDMEALAEIGGKRIAAPPVGATKEAGLDLFKAAERYRALLELGEECGGVIPQVEVWGFSKNLSRLGESAFVAIEAGHPKACLLTDVYHIYKGGSDFAGMGLFSAQMLQVMHMNDYPDMPRNEIGDADRVWPGVGVAPISDILQMMARAGARPVLSLELFNKEYWKMDVAEVAKVGLEKMRSAVLEAGV